MSKILIIGATSTIAEACARLWAAQGEELFLVGRNEERLSRIAADLQIRGAAKVSSHVMDINDIEGHAAMLDRAQAELGGLDTVLIAHGTLSNQEKCEHDVDLMLHEMKTNALSVTALLTLIANNFEAKRSGTIAVISSVAGDRGRQSNYVYGSAKALVTAFSSGLRQRLHRSGVAVVTIKPGFVDTSMTRDFQKGMLWSSPGKVAKTIVGAMSAKRDIVYTPWFWSAVMTGIGLIPESLFKRAGRSRTDSAPSPDKTPKTTFGANMLPALLIGAVLVIALYLRLASAWFGYPLVTHPDEPTLVGVAEAIWKTLDLNPHFFNYPSLVVYIQAATMAVTSGLYYVTTGIGPGEISRVDFHVAGRIVASVASVASIFITYLVGARLFRKSVGMMAAGLLALSPIHIDNSAMVAVDIWVASFATLVLYFCAKIYEQQSPRDYVLAGMCVGLAASSKYTGVLFCTSVLVAHALASHQLWVVPRGLMWRTFLDRKLLSAAASTIVAFALTTPFSILDPITFARHVVSEGRHYRAGHLGNEAAGDVSFGLYGGTLVSFDGLGPIAIALAIFSLLLSTRKEYRSVLLVAALPISLFLFVGSHKVFFPRNIVGALPALAILAGVSIHFLVNQLPFRRTCVSALCSICFVVIAWPLAVKAIEDVRAKQLPDTRLISLRWAEANLPTGSKLAVEAYAPPVEQSGRGFEVVQLGVAGLLNNRDKIAKDVDYVILSSGSYGRFFERDGVAKEMYGSEAGVYAEFFRARASELTYEVREQREQTTGPTIRIYKIRR